ncbi:amino acid adenylation domain-containing protein [Polaribacter sp.]|uniref:amino acid adenylation domain-containing protein n=1 Tax=Polaribacter sp. TaxID=1920175 RepID=UPI003EF86C81
MRNILLKYIERNVKEIPLKKAILSSNSEYTYKDLGRMVNCLFKILDDSGIEPGDIVGLKSDKSFMQIASLIAIIKKGAIYLPLDNKLPTKRIEYIIANSGVKFILTDKEPVIEIDQVNWLNFKNIDIDRNQDVEVKSEEGEFLYILYTSGSTGLPKGVLFRTVSFENLIEWQLLHLDPEIERVAQFAPLGFDVSLQEILSTLCFGKTLVLISEQIRRVPKSLLQFLNENNIGRIFLPYVMIQELTVAYEKEPIPIFLKEVISAGEQLLLTKPIKTFFKEESDCRLINQYGPTEAHVVSAYALPPNVDDWAEIAPIGIAIDNVGLHIISDGKETAKGEIGELFISGVCLAQGYINNDELTNELFIPLPTDTSIKSYKTGDLVKVQEDGNILFCGRSDYQVKISGYRVEPAEIEVVIAGHPQVSQAVVQIYKDGLIPLVCAFYILKEKNQVDCFSSIKQYLREQLPEYMLPSKLTKLDEIPKTVSGKIDRSKLKLDRVRPPLMSQYKSPNNSLENQVKEIWERCLVIEDIGVNDPFFDLGGNSILAVTVIEQINQTLDLEKSLDIISLFEYPTIRGIANLLQGDLLNNEEEKDAPLENKEKIKRIAIVGMACNLPGAADLENFWKNIKGGKLSVQSIPKGDIESGNIQLREDEDYMHYAGILDDIEYFDADFFGFSAREASIMDPQHRLALQCAYQALENAGYYGKQSISRVGVFAGCGFSTYLLNNVHPATGMHQNRTFLESSNELQLMVANDKDYLATRIAFKLNLKGPAVTVQTACSTSLVAIHMAAESILKGECEAAIAGGVNITVPQKCGYLYQPDMVFSKNGQCRPFDKNATGTVFGSGIGMVVLKDYDKAIKDGDRIYSVLLGSAINNDGGEKAGFITPSSFGQQDVILKSIRAAKINPDTIGYVEAHGTGTILGDPLEIRSLSKVYRKYTDQLSFCALGSVKANIGHLSWASGVVGFIKTALCLYYETIPPQINFEQANERMNLSDSPFYINNGTSKIWETNSSRRAAVSSFGIGGTNAHAILEEHDHPKERTINLNQKVECIPISAPSVEGLENQLRGLMDYLQKGNCKSISDLAFSQIMLKPLYSNRTLISAKSLEELTSKTQILLEQKIIEENDFINTTPVQKRKLAFVYTGQGVQYSSMGKYLFESNEVFREVIIKCDQYLQKIDKVSLLDLLFSEKDKSLMHQIKYTQVAVFSFEYALTQCYLSLGIIPDVLIGHSTGEYVAACVAEVFSLEEGLWLSLERGKLMDEFVSEEGRMISILTGTDKVEKWIEQYEISISIAAINGIVSTVASGDKVGIEELSKKCSEEGIKWKELIIDRAGHSPLMDAMKIPFMEVLRQIDYNIPKIPIVSNLSGVSGQKEDFIRPEYWSRHTRETVLFYNGIEHLLNKGVTTFLEIGPSPVLLGLIEASFPDSGLKLIPTFSRSSKRNILLQEKEFYNSISALYESGVNINWKSMNSNSFDEKKKSPIPYKFAKQKYWIAPPEKGNFVLVNSTESDNMKDAYCQIIWERNDSNITEFHGIDSLSYQVIVLIDKPLTNHSRQFLENAFANYTCFNISDINNEIVFLDKIIGGKENLMFVYVSELETDLSFNSSFYEKLKHQIHQIITFFQKLIQIKYDNINFYQITASAQKVMDDDIVCNFIGRCIQGVLRSLSLEITEINFGFLDFSKGETINKDTFEKVFAILLNRQEIAIRENRVYLPYLKSKNKIPKSKQSKLDENGVYIISGGFGGLGKITAEFLGEHGVQQIILFGRSSLNQDRNTYLKNFKHQYPNTEINYYKIDCSKEEEVSSFFESISNKELPVLGIFQTAGAIEDATILNQSIKTIETCFIPKVLGTIVLHNNSIKYFKELKYFVTFSSIVSIIGNHGQSNHGGANAFMDALSSYRKSQHLPSHNINWGAWSEAGELKGKLEIQQHLKSLGFNLIGNNEGKRVIGNVINMDWNQLIVIPMNWSNYLETIPNRQKNRYETFIPKIVTENEKKKSIKQQFVDLSINEQNQFVILKVKEVFNSVIGYLHNESFELDENKSVFEYGVDSLTSIQVRNKLKRIFEVEISVTFIFDNPTIKGITNLLTEKLQTSQEIEKENKNEKVINGQLEKLSFQQERWVQLIQKGYGYRVVPIIFNYKLDENKLRIALRKIISRHNSLRYYYGEDCVKILNVNEMPIFDDNALFTNISKLNLEEKQIVLKRFCEERYKVTRSGKISIPWEIKIFKLKENRFVLFLCLQHIDFDGVSLTTFSEELKKTYENELGIGKHILPNYKQYEDYIDWQQKYCQNDIKNDRSFFQGVFSTTTESTLLSEKHSLKITQPQKSVRWSQSLSIEKYNQLSLVSIKEGVSLFSIIFSAYARAIGKIKSLREVLIAVISSGRAEEKYANTIGPFTAPFPLKIDLRDEPILNTALRLNHLVIQYNMRSHYPVSDMTKHVGLFSGFPMDTYFTDIGINFTNYKKEKKSKNVKIIEILGPTLEEEFVECPPSSIKRIPGIHLVVNELEGGLSFNFWYHEKRFKVEYIKKLYHSILEEINI